MNPTIDIGVVISIQTKTGEVLNTYLMEFIFAATLNEDYKIVANLWDVFDANDNQQSDHPS